MRPTRYINCRVEVVFCFVTIMLISACASVEPTRIQLDRAVHFATPDGNDVVVHPGAYRIEQATGSQLRLVTSGDAPPILLGAEAVHSDLDLGGPIAMAIPFEPDAYDLVLLVPGSSGLAAHGSVSGVQSRALLGVNPLTTVQGRLEAVGPDLVGNMQRSTWCGYGSGWNALFGYQCYTSWVGVVKNQGNTDAGPSIAWISSCSFNGVLGSTGSSRFSVSSIKPGETVYVPVFSANEGYCKQPFTWSVDALNAVTETNEGNNISGPFSK